MNEPIYPYDYDKIPGFGDIHDFPGFYEKFVDMAPAGATIIEVGCYQGRSLVQLGQYAKFWDKGLRIIGVDHMKDQSGGMAETLRNNLKAAGLGDFVEFMHMDSVSAAALFEDESVWMVFIDANHEPGPVAADIRAWMPKIRKDGWLTGHDAIWYTVWWVVCGLLDNVLHDPTWNNCWFARKQELKEGLDIAGILDPHRYHREGKVPTVPFGSGDKRNDGLPAGTIIEP